MRACRGRGVSCRTVRPGSPSCGGYFSPERSRKVGAGQAREAHYLRRMLHRWTQSGTGQSVFWVQQSRYPFQRKFRRSNPANLRLVSPYVVAERVVAPAMAISTIPRQMISEFTLEISSIWFERQRIPFRTLGCLLLMRALRATALAPRSRTRHPLTLPRHREWGPELARLRHDSWLHPIAMQAFWRLPRLGSVAAGRG